MTKTHNIVSISLHTEDNGICPELSSIGSDSTNGAAIVAGGLKLEHES